jgi:hypothetical protein
MVVDLTVLVRSYRRLISGEPKPDEGCLAKGDPTISVHASLTYRGPSSSMVSECLTPDDTADIAQSLSCEAQVVGPDSHGSQRTWVLSLMSREVDQRNISEAVKVLCSLM